MRSLNQTIVLFYGKRKMLINASGIARNFLGRENPWQFMGVLAISTMFQYNLLSFGEISAMQIEMKVTK